MKSLLGLILCAASLAAAEQELGLTLGSILSRSREAGGVKLDIGSGTALQANYGIRIAGNDGAAIFFETHFLASPQRKITSASAFLTRDIATLYVTPGIRVKFMPKAFASPYVVIGGGYGQYEQSATVLGGGANPAPRHLHRGVVDFGGGVDGKLWGNWLGWRVEVRDFYSGSPAFNAPQVSGGQHNVVAGGGFVIKWGGR